MPKYTLFPRKVGKQHRWYFYPYDSEGNRLTAKSTGIGFSREKDKVKSRREAVAYCELMNSKGKLTDIASPTLNAWIKGNHFWEWNKSKYIRGILARSPKDKPGITESYCRKCDHVTDHKIIRYHGFKRIQDITPYDCEQLLFRWLDMGYAAATVNNWKYIYSTILGEYERELKMRNPESKYFNPWKLVKPLGSDKNKYGGLTISEVKKIIHRDAVLCGGGGYKYYMASKIAFLTGLRMGEVLGLYKEDIRDEHIGNIRMSYLLVSKSYNFDLNKRVPTKDKDTRQVPISAELRDELDQFLHAGNMVGFLLSFSKGKTPLSPNHVRKWLYNRMADIGISEEERQERHIAFHSSRRFFNTLLRSAQVADSVIQRFTGHDNDKMTEHYTDYLPEDLQEITRAQSKLLTED